MVHLGSARPKLCMLILRSFSFRKHQEMEEIWLSVNSLFPQWMNSKDVLSLTALHISTSTFVFLLYLCSWPLLQMKIPYCKLSFCPHPLSSHCQGWEIMGNVILEMKEWKTLSNPISSTLSSRSCTLRRMVQTAQLWIIKAENINCLVVESDALSARIVP